MESLKKRDILLNFDQFSWIFSEIMVQKPFSLMLTITCWQGRIKLVQMDFSSSFENLFFYIFYLVFSLRLKFILFSS